jgi:hypothetical protein
VNDFVRFTRHNRVGLLREQGIDVEAEKIREKLNEDENKREEKK